MTFSSVDNDCLSRNLGYLDVSGFFGCVSLILQDWSTWRATNSSAQVVSICGNFTRFTFRRFIV